MLRRSMTAPEVPETWEIYPAYSDGKPAMFFLNMGLIQVAPLEELPQLYLIKVQMEEPADNGLGTNAEAQRFMPFEDAVRDAAAAAGMLMAGRVRTDGYWEVGFYGPSGVDFTDVLDNAGPAVAGFEIMLGGADDPNWGLPARLPGPRPRALAVDPRLPRRPPAAGSRRRAGQAPPCRPHRPLPRRRLRRRLHRGRAAVRLLRLAAPPRRKPRRVRPHGRTAARRSRHRRPHPRRGHGPRRARRKARRRLRRLGAAPSRNRPSLLR